MKGYHFFLEYDSSSKKRRGTRKNLGDHKGNVMAVYSPMIYRNGIIEAVAAISLKANSPVSTTTFSEGYLRIRCKRISEKQAREIHPELFKRLD